MQRQGTHKAALLAMALVGGLFGLWATAAILGGLLQAGSIAELARQYMVATGLIRPLHTMVDFYTHIKGIEYLICVAFFAVFPAFFTYVNREKQPAALHHSTS